MIKRWLTHKVWQTRISSRIFLKIQHVHNQKMNDPPYDRPGSHLEFFLKIQCVHGQRMIDPSIWQTRISPRIFLKIQHVHGQKMIDPPSYDWPGSYPEFFF